MKTSILAIPKGSLEKIKWPIEKIGIPIPDARKSTVEIDGAGIFNQLAVIRPQNIPQMVNLGLVAAGICGRDCVCEAGLENVLEEICEFQFGKQGNQAVRIAVFGKTEEIIDREDVLVFSEYPRLTQNVFKKARVIVSGGATETCVDIAGSHIAYGVGVVETGRSLAANGLKIVKVIMESPVVLIAKKKTPELEVFGKILRGAWESEKYYLLKFNADSDCLDKVLRYLPSLKSPTVGKLADRSFSIETVIEKQETAAVLLAIKQAGARDILIQDINVVLP